MMTVTPLYAAACGVMFIALSARVSRLRNTLDVPLGHGDKPEMEKAIRVHANFAEFVPMALLLMALVELEGGRAWVLHALGASLVAGRVLHAMGLTRTRGVSFGRFVGTTLTWVMILAASAACVVYAV